MRSPKALFAAVALTSLAGCGESDRAIREWQPSDHAQPAQADPARTPTEATDDRQTVARAAAALFRASCASCHGESGRGDGGAVPAGAAMPDLTAASFHDERTDAQIAAVIANGRGLMPGFRSQLNERGIAALVAHVRTLRAP